MSLAARFRALRESSIPAQPAGRPGWIALKKNLLAEVLGAGRDARIVGLPLDAAQVLRFMCTDLVIAENVADQASVPPSIEKA